MATNEIAQTHWKLKLPWRRHSQSPPSRSASPTKKKYVPIDFTQNISQDIPYPPFINIIGVPNFRDLGGYACHSPSSAGKGSDGQQSVRTGFAFRCSELSQITLEGRKHMIDDLKIKTLFDLRSEREAANPSGRPIGVKCYSTPVFRRQDLTQAMAVQQLRWATLADETDEIGFSQGYVDWYRQIAIYGGKYAYRIIFEHIRDKPDKAFVFHCSAGKDRTGVLSAIILKLCGVEDSTVAWEYALTVPGMGVWENMVESEMVGDSMMPIRSHDGMTKEEAHRLCGSRASNMLHWLQVVLEQEFGGAAQYLERNLHFSEKDVQKITKNLLAAKSPSVKPVAVPGMESHPQT